MREIVRRAIQGRPELTTELLRRGVFSVDEKKEMLQIVPALGVGLPGLPLGPVQFSTLLAEGDAQLAAHVVLRELLRPNELAWLYRLLRFQRPNDKRDELVRVIERAMEGRKGNARGKH